VSFHLFNEALGKEITSKEEKFQLACGREENIHTWERERSFSEKERSDSVC